MKVQEQKSESVLCVYLPVFTAAEPLEPDFYLLNKNS